MKKRNLSGNYGIGIFIIGLVCVCVAFGTSAWLVSDYRITGAKLNQLGLWRQCYRSLPIESDPPKRFFVGCRWIYERLNAGYSEIQGFRLPAFMIITQIFYTLCFISCLIAFGLILLFGLGCNPGQKRYVELISSIGYLLLFGGGSGIIAVIVFACFTNTEDWMPGYETNYFGWSFGTAVVGAVLILIASGLFLVEWNSQRKDRNYLRRTETRY